MDIPRTWNLLDYTKGSNLAGCTVQCTQMDTSVRYVTPMEHYASSCMLYSQPYVNLGHRLNAHSCLNSGY